MIHDDSGDSSAGDSAAPDGSELDAPPPDQTSGDDESPGLEEAERAAAYLRGEARGRAPEGAYQRDPYRGLAPPEVAHRAFAALADNVRDYAIFLMDVEGVITFWGEGARLLKRWTKLQAEGAHLRMLYPQGGSEDGSAEEHLRQAAESGEYIGQGHRIRGDRTTFWARVSLTALRDSEGKLIGFAKVTRDMTARRAEELATVIAREHAQTAIRLKGELLQQLERASEEARQVARERTDELTGTSARLEQERAERTRLEARRFVLLRQLLAAEENERLRLSRELHDHLGQLVTALRLGLSALGRGVAPAPAAIDDLSQLSLELARELSHIASDLRPPALDRLGLIPALRGQVDDWSARYRIAADFEAVGVTTERFSSEVETTLYRAVQEGLTNAAKHAGAQHVSVLLIRRPDSIGVVVEDDGIGFDVASVTESAAHTRRFGLVGVRERVDLLGGSFRIESSEGGGSTLFVQIPV